MTTKKKLAIFIPLGILLLLFIAAAVLMQNKIFSTARIIKTDNGGYLWVSENGGPNFITEKWLCNLDDLDTGDKVLLFRDDIVLDSYPGQNTVYFAYKLESGKPEDIPKSTITSLLDLGWNISGMPWIEGSKTNIKNIVDHSVDDGVSYDTALEPFYSDEKYNYYFPNIISQYVIVTFKDDTKKTAKEALQNGEITIADLDAFNINYIIARRGPSGDADNILSPTPQEPEENVYCGNTQTTIKKDGKEYTFMGGDSVTLTNLLRTLNYDRGVCKCRPDFTVTTEFGTGYGIKLLEGDSYVRYNGKQATLTKEQKATIKKIIKNQCK